jgi:DNA polymerase-4
MTLAQARRACPTAAFRAGDLENYARMSEEVAAILLAASRRVERPSSDEAYVDLTPETPASIPPVRAAEAIKDEIQRRLGLDASLGLASCRLAARIASAWARPRGLLLVLPGYEASFLAKEPITRLPDLPPHVEAGLARVGISTLGDLLSSDPATLRAAVGGVAEALLAAARGDEPPIATSAPPVWIQEEVAIRSSRNGRADLEVLLDGLAERAARRLAPFGLEAGALTVEVRREDGSLRRTENVSPGLSDAATTGAVARTLALPLLEPPRSVRGLSLRLGRLDAPRPQAPLFPEMRRLAR